MPAKPKSYGAAVEQARQSVAAAALADPDSHFPYKHDVVVALLAENTPMGPGIPDSVDGAADSSRTVADYMSPGIADASRDYIEAQAVWLAGPTGDTYADYQSARDRLQAARLDHRQNRGDGFTVGAAARRAG